MRIGCSPPLPAAARRHARPLAAIVILAAVVAVAGCGRQQPSAAPGAQAASKAAPASASGGGQAASEQPLAHAHAEVEVGEIVVAEPKGKRLWRASAKTIEWDYDKQQAVLHDVQCVFSENGKTSLEARAPLVTAYLKDQRVVLTGGVVARAPATSTAVRADRLEWDLKDKEVYATGNVKYVRGDFEVTGSRLRADLQLKRARLEGDVRMQAVEPLRGK
jgi:LPS export ABC transporter protein LptC